MVTADSATASVIGSPRAELSLKIVGTRRDGQLVRLRSGKCSIGSDRRCTLRLRAAAVRPMHCLILRGTDRTTVRSWSPDTLLNGRAFDAAELVAGDRLTCGPIQLEVLPAETSDREPIDELDEREAQLRAAELELSRREAELAERQAQVEARRQELISERQAWEQSCAEERAERESEQPPEDNEMTTPRQASTVDTNELAGRERPELEENVLERLRSLTQQVDAVEDDEAEPTATSQVEVVESVEEAAEAEEDEQPAAARSTRNKPASTADEDEESIEAYMARLLNRSRGGSADSAEQPAPSRRRSAPSPSPAPPVQAEPTPVAPPPKPARQKAPAPPRAKAEERSDLAAMRELANLQARAAIQRHATTRSWRAPAVAWLVALACVGLSAVAFSVIAKGGVLVLLSGLAGLAAAGYWGYQGVKLTAQLLAARRYGQAGSNPTAQPGATKPAQAEQQNG